MKLTSFAAIIAGAISMLLTQTAQGQTLTNLSVKAVSVTASASDEDHPVSLICDNRTTASNYWSGYHGDESLGCYVSVELGWA